MEDRRLKNGELLFIQGEPDENLYRLKDGSIILYFSFNELKLLDFIKENEFFGFSHFNNNISAYCAESYGESVVEVFSPADSEFWLKNSYELLFNTSLERLRKRIYDPGISSEFDIIPFFKNVKVIDEAFFSRFFAYQLVRKAINYLEDQEAVKKTDRGKYVFKEAF